MAAASASDLDLPHIHARVLTWYAANGRDLPWRRTSDPYAVLVAEFMLQQTQVERVVDRWPAWLEQFPTLAALAASSRADVIRAWHGLGYNLRAVRLHNLARQVVEQHDGRLPSDLPRLMQLDGIGRYTAGAVACFGYRRPVAMVDTNIRRVLSRLVLGCDESSAASLQRLADQMLPLGDAYPWNQALMDVGATICRPARPLCLACPLVDVCRARVAPRRPRPPGAAAARRAPRFENTDRYVRGRIVGLLRTLPAGASLSREVLRASLPARAPEHVDRLLSQLARDGLLESSETGFSLPDR